MEKRQKCAQSVRTPLIVGSVSFAGLRHDGRALCSSTKLTDYFRRDLSWLLEKYSGERDLCTKNVNSLGGGNVQVRSRRWSGGWMSLWGTLGFCLAV